MSAAGKVEFEKVKQDILTRYGTNGFDFGIDLDAQPLPILRITLLTGPVACGAMWYWDKSALLAKEGPAGVTKKCQEIARKHGVRLEQLKIAEEDVDLE